MGFFGFIKSTDDDDDYDAGAGGGDDDDVGMGDGDDDDVGPAVDGFDVGCMLVSFIIFSISAGRLGDRGFKSFTVPSIL